MRRVLHAGADTTALAGEGDQKVVPTVVAACPGKAVDKLGLS